MGSPASLIEVRQADFRDYHPKAWKGIQVTLTAAAILAAVGAVVAIHLTVGLQNLTHRAYQTEISVAQGLLYIGLPSVALTALVVLFGKYVIFNTPPRPRSSQIVRISPVEIEAQSSKKEEKN